MGGRPGKELRRAGRWPRGVGELSRQKHPRLTPQIDPDRLAETLGPVRLEQEHEQVVADRQRAPAGLGLEYIDRVRLRLAPCRGEHGVTLAAPVGSVTVDASAVGR